MKEAPLQRSAVDVTRLTQRFSRQALRRPNLAYVLWRFAANGVRTGRAFLARRSYADTPAIDRELRERGIVVGASARFLTDEGQQALRAGGDAVLESSRRAGVDAAHASDDGRTPRKKAFLVHLVSYEDGMAPGDPLLRVALDPKLLEIVSGYFGFWPCLHSVGAWRNYPTEAPPEVSQLWHRDPEDLQVVKVFIYLTDVGEQSGPFTYVPGTHPFGPGNAPAQKLEKKKRVADDLMTRVFPREAWQVCTGPASTMILADTVGYHRGGKPLVGDRILITFTYTSATPMTDRSLWVRGRPAWATSPLQRFALAPLLRAGVAS